jgi:uncharacterized oxidoreductase
MDLQGNTMLITGGGSGIGLALAEQFRQLGNEVIVAGRSPDKLENAQAKGLKISTVDMGDEASIRALASQLVAQYPALNVVIHNAGVMVNEKLTSRDNSKVAAETVAANLLGPIYLTNALLPHFLKQESATIILVTSGLAYVPLAMTPTYSATKAAIHSYTQSLRYQLQGTAVEVKELVPPYVRTGLMGERQASDPNAMPLEEFVGEVMAILRDEPDTEEILVKRVLPQRLAGSDDLSKYTAFFKKQNDTLMSIRKKEWDDL